MAMPRLLLVICTGWLNPAWGESVPAADILNRIAKALDVSTDYLLNGTLQDKSADAITDEELLLQFRKVEQLPANKKKLVKEFLDDPVKKSKSILMKFQEGFSFICCNKQHY